MKKFLSIICVLIVILTFVGCKNNSYSTSKATNPINNKTNSEVVDRSNVEESYENRVYDDITKTFNDVDNVLNGLGNDNFEIEDKSLN